MRPLALIVLLSACSSTLTTFDDKGTPNVDGFDTGETTGDDDDATTGDDDDDVIVGDDDDDTIVGDDDDTTTTPNNAPVAAANVTPVQVFVGSQVTIDGSASYDPDGDPLTYFYDDTLFVRPATSGANMISNQELAEFLADRPGTYTLYLEVDDGIDTDVLEINIVAEEPNLEPVANAGVTIRAIVGTIVALDGSGSYDPNNDPISYNWMITQAPGGSAGLISGTSTVSPQLQLDKVGDYKVGLQVTDSGGLTSSIAEVRIISEPEPSTGGSDSCFSCAQANLELERRLSAGDAAGGFGLVLLPLILLMLQRRDDD
jgi:hypothetical protein